MCQFLPLPVEGGSPSRVNAQKPEAPYFHLAVLHTCPDCVLRRHTGSHRLLAISVYSGQKLALLYEPVCKDIRVAGNLIDASV